MLGHQDAHIIHPFTRPIEIRLARQSRLPERVRDAFTLVACSDFVSKPRNEFGTPHIKFFLGLETSDLEASFLAILLCNNNPAVIVFLVFSEELFERGSVNCYFCADVTRPEILRNFHSKSPQNIRVEASNKYVALHLISKRKCGVVKGVLTLLAFQKAPISTSGCFKELFECP